MRFGYQDIEKLQKKGLKVQGISNAELIKKSKEETIPIGKLYIENQLVEKGINFEPEKIFSKRKFRLDYYFEFNGQKYGVEYEGIFASKETDSGKSRHTNYTGYTTDCTKYNMAILFGIKVLRYTAKNYKEFSSDLNFIVNGCE